MRIMLLLLGIGGMFGSFEFNYQNHVRYAPQDSIRIIKINKRIGRTVSQCYYWKGRSKIDSVGVEADMDTCIPFQILKKIKMEYVNEYNAPPTLVNVAAVRSSRKTSNDGLGVGLYVFYLGYTSHPSLFKLLVFEDKVCIRLKRTDSDIHFYKKLFKEFDDRYANIFNKKERKEMRSVFLEGVIDI